MDHFRAYIGLVLGEGGVCFNREESETAVAMMGGALVVYGLAIESNKLINGWRYGVGESNFVLIPSCVAVF